MPSAPNSRALAESCGVSAFVRTPSFFTLSHRLMKATKFGFSPTALMSGRASGYTVPLEPFRVIQSPSRMTVPLTVIWRLPTSTCISPAPTMQHLPQPRATSAACEVMPPRAVRMPWAARIPSTSSGLVSSRTRITCLPAWVQSTASLAVSTTWPTAPPGPAGRPLTRIFASFSLAGSMMGCSSSSICAGVIRVTASSASISLSRAISTAMRTAAGPLRLPTRHCSIHSLPRSMVNSRSSMSL